MRWFKYLGLKATMAAGCCALLAFLTVCAVWVAIAMLVFTILAPFGVLMIPTEQIQIFTDALDLKAEKDKQKPTEN